ncbi:inositol monophosphatase/fructose-1,6-bisphosphatase family protein [Microvirga lotononidis]|uniref:Inositol-1-monophosphatase n=2 Tax=Microvirga lotononidis TaxID=864069 RepID=I4YQQ5_9HYPH|nr:inositol monophosphatase/fructose-1,6-bisphosphatase family protein [Microvirga lotononidis]
MFVKSAGQVFDLASHAVPGEIGLRLPVACAAAREAGSLARRRFNGRPGLSSINLKGHQDYLSAVDAEVEALLRLRLLESFPEDSFFGEEGGGSFDNNVWVVDPVDGTANFVRGISQFCISLAYVRGGQTQIGIIYDPMADEMFVAERGRGATLNGELIRVSGLEEIGSSTIEAGWSNRLPFSQYVDLIGRLLGDGAGIRRGGSGALALAYVSAGRLDGYCELHMNSWDALAGLLLIEEAGGWVNDFLANDGLRNGNGVLGCTPGLRERLVRLTGVVSSSGPPPRL